VILLLLISSATSWRFTLQSASIVVRGGIVLLNDPDTNTDIIAMTATQAAWLSFFLQAHVTSELIVQLRLAATHANSQLIDPQEAKTFPLKKG